MRYGPAQITRVYTFISTKRWVCQEKTGPATAFERENEKKLVIIPALNPFFSVIRRATRLAVKGCNPRANASKLPSVPTCSRWSPRSGLCAFVAVETTAIRLRRRQSQPSPIDLPPKLQRIRLDAFALAASPRWPSKQRANWYNYLFLAILRKRA